jgi:hypothetical protein
VLETAAGEARKVKGNSGIKVGVNVCVPGVRFLIVAVMVDVTVGGRGVLVDVGNNVDVAVQVGGNAVGGLCVALGIDVGEGWI